MAELTVKMTVQSWHIGTVADKFDEWAELVQWCIDTDGMYCSMAPQADSSKGVEIQVGGRQTGTVYATLDSYVLYNGYQFEVLTRGEYQTKYGAAQHV